MDDVTDPQTLKNEEKNEGQSLVEVESMILRYISDMEKLRQEIKEQNDMFKSTFEGDATYSKKKEEEEKLKKEVAATKQVLAKTPAAAEAEAKVKELKEDLRSLQGTIEILLNQRQKLTDVNQIIRDDGEVYEVKTKVSLVKKSSKYNP